MEQAVTLGFKVVVQASAVSVFIGKALLVGHSRKQRLGVGRLKTHVGEVNQQDKSLAFAHMSARNAHRAGGGSSAAGVVLCYSGGRFRPYRPDIGDGRGHALIVYVIANATNIAPIMQVFVAHLFKSYLCSIGKLGRSPYPWHGGNGKSDKHEG